MHELMVDAGNPGMARMHQLTVDGSHGGTCKHEA
jgi:hypothetical protein